MTTSTCLGDYLLAVAVGLHTYGIEQFTITHRELENKNFKSVGYYTVGAFRIVKACLTSDTAHCINDQIIGINNNVLYTYQRSVHTTASS